MPSTRRFLSVLVLELKYSGFAVQRLAPDEIQTGFELFWHSFYRFVSDEDGVPLPPQSQEFIALFGAETPYADHAVRASKAAAAISTWLREWAFKFSLTGREIPHFSIALHSGESVAMQIPGSDTLPWAVVGEALSFSRTLIRVSRQDEVVCSESFLTSLLENLPPGQESLTISTEEEPDLGGLNWDVADFVPLEEHLRNRTVLVGKNVTAAPEAASLWFTYLYAFSDPDTGGSARVAAVFFSGTIPAMEVSGALADNEAQFRRLGKYRLLKPLGHGGMGTVWLGQDGFGNYAALKTLLDPTSVEKTQIIRFEREAQVMSQLNHRNICRIIEMSEYDGIRFIAMEYVTGVTLADILENVPGQTESSKQAPANKQQTPADLPSIVRDVQKKKLAQMLRKRRRSSDPPTPVLRLTYSISLFVKICDAVEFAHGKGILHRDLKPGNVLIREDGDPVVSDFGLAKLRQGNDGFDVSHTGQVIGTLAYMAPEQSQSSKDVDERADVFSLGAIFYRMLSGAEQYRTTGNFAADVQALQSHEPVPPSKARPSIPEDLDAIVMKALGKNPAVRYRSVQALRDDVARFQSGEPVRARPPSSADMALKMYQRHRVIVHSLGGSLVFALALIVVAFFSITVEKNRALEAEARAQAAMRTAQEEKRKAESSLIELKAEQTKTGSLTGIIATMETSHDVHASRPTEPYATKLRSEGAEGQSSEANARQILEKLASNPGLRSLFVGQSPDGRWQHFPEDILSNLGAATESSATARILNPNSSEALVLSGWCALLDFDIDSAREYFLAAEAASEDPRGRERCRMLAEACAPTSDSSAGTIPDEIVPNLRNTGNEFDRKLSSVLSSLHGAVQQEEGLAISDYRDILALPPGPLAIAATFLQGNPDGKLNVLILHDSSRRSKLYINGEDIKDLAPLTDILRRLRIAYPGKSWLLNLSHTASEKIPLLDVEAIVARDSDVSSIDISAEYPLQELDLSGSKFSNLLLLANAASLKICRLNNCPVEHTQRLFDRDVKFASTLTTLEIQGVRVDSLAGISHLRALETLKFSPQMVEQKNSIRELQQMTKLRFISADGDMDGQEAGTFWQKHRDLP